MNLNDRVVEVIAEQLDVEKERVVESATIEGDLEADELQVVELTVALEEEFGLKIPDDDQHRLHNVEGIMGYIESIKSGCEKS